MILGEPETICVSRNEENFDKACHQAYFQALGRFGCDDSGYWEVDGFSRSTDSVVVSFSKLHITGNMGGITFEYTFIAYIERYEEE